ncbi:MAG: hypothetical protein NUV57_03495 [archaeon]|nr:hypothetical protein [archaeon]
MVNLPGRRTKKTMQRKQGGLQFREEQEKRVHHGRRTGKTAVVRKKIISISKPGTAEFAETQGHYHVPAEKVTGKMEKPIIWNKGVVHTSRGDLIVSMREFNGTAETPKKYSKVIQELTSAGLNLADTHVYMTPEGKLVETAPRGIVSKAKNLQAYANTLEKRKAAVNILTRIAMAGYHPSLVNIEIIEANNTLMLLIHPDSGMIRVKIAEPELAARELISSINLLYEVKEHEKAELFRIAREILKAGKSKLAQHLPSEEKIKEAIERDDRTVINYVTRFPET